MHGTLTPQDNNTGTPSRLRGWTRVWLMAAAIKWALVLFMLATGDEPPRHTMIGFACAMILSLVALYRLAQEESGIVFRLGLRIGRICRLGRAQSR